MRYTKILHDRGTFCPWYRPVETTEMPDGMVHRLKCCDCSLVHDVQFRVKRGRIEWRIRRNNRATAASRRPR